MRKVRKLNFWGILSVLVGVLFLSVISSTPAQAGEDTWAVRIPTQSDGKMLYGMGTDGYYENGSFVEVSVQKSSMSGSWNRYYDFVYKFNFKLTNEHVGTGVAPTNYVGFQNVRGLYEVTYPDDDKYCCQFPPNGCPHCLNCLPDCMANFLNNTHPYSDGNSDNDYEYFQSQIQVFDKDIENMYPGEVYTFGTSSDPGDPGDLFGMIARYREGCYAEPAFHDVEFYRSINYWRAVDSGNALNIVIIKLDSYDIECEGVWRILVYPGDYPFDNYFAGDEAYLRVKERYCAVEKNKSTWYYPMQAKGNFDFYIDFIKNPGASTEPDPDPEPPAAPSNLGAAATACNQIDLSWTDNSENETGFKIERDGTYLTTVGANVTSYADTTVSENTFYSYRVQACNDAGCSDYSNIVSATTPPCSTDLVAPSNLTVKQPGRASKVNLQWTDNSDNEEGFKIYRDSDLIATVGANTTSYEDSTIQSGVTYFYTVCAYKGEEVACSDTVPITTK